MKHTRILILLLAVAVGAGVAWYVTPPTTHAQTADATVVTDLYVQDDLTVVDAVTVGGLQTFNGQVVLGDGGDTVAINSSAWDITAAGAASGFTTMAMTGALSVTGGTINVGGAAQQGTVAFPFTGVGGALITSATATTGAAQGGEFRIAGDLVAAELAFEFTDNAGGSQLLTLAGDGDLTVTKDVAAVQGIFSGAVSGTTATFTGVSALGDDVTITDGSLTVTDSDGFNANSGELVIGVPTAKLDIVAGANGTQDVVLQTFEAGQAATLTAAGAEAPAVADDAVTYRVGSGSLKVTFTAGTAVGNATVSMPTGANWDGSADEYLFIWVYSDAVLSANTLTLTLDDNDAAPDPVLNVPAVTVANQWQLLRVDMSAVADADKNVVSDVVLTSNHATELQSAVVYFDQFVKVDNAEATALAFNAANQPAGARSAFSFVEDAGDGTFAALTEWTDYFIDYQNDRIYWISDVSSKNVFLYYATTN